MAESQPKSTLNSQYHLEENIHLGRKKSDCAT